MFLLYKFLVNVRINLRGADVGVPEEFLQYAQVHTRLQAVRCKTVPEGMRRDLLAQVRGMLLHDFPRPHAGHRLPAWVQDDIVRCRVGEGPAIFDPGAQVFFRLAPEGHQALLVALSDRREPFVFEVELRELDSEGLRDAEPRAVHEFEQRRVAQRVLAVGRALENAVHLLAGEVLRQVVPELRAFEHRFGAVVVLALVLHVLEEPAQARKMPRDGRGGVFLLPGGERQEFIQFFGGQRLEI